MDGMEIVPYFELLLADGVTWESVPLGRFYVGEANHTAAGVVIRAYDAMSKLDKKCSVLATSGTPYQLARFACEACFLQLATDQETFTSFANGSEVLSLWQDGTDIDIHYLAERLEGSVVLPEDEEGAKILSAHKGAVYLFMSSKDIYNIAEMTKKYL